MKFYMRVLLQMIIQPYGLELGQVMRVLIFSSDLSSKPILLLCGLPNAKDLHHLLLSTHILRPNVPKNYNDAELPCCRLGHRHIPRLRAAMQASESVLGPVHQRPLLQLGHVYHCEPSFQCGCRLCHSISASPDDLAPSYGDTR
jgi:hypothetical protein